MKSEPKRSLENDAGESGSSPPTAAAATPRSAGTVIGEKEGTAAVAVVNPINVDTWKINIGNYRRMVRRTDMRNSVFIAIDIRDIVYAAPGGSWGTKRKCKAWDRSGRSPGVSEIGSLVASTAAPTAIQLNKEMTVDQLVGNESSIQSQSARVSLLLYTVRSPLFIIMSWALMRIKPSIRAHWVFMVRPSTS